MKEKIKTLIIIILAILLFLTSLGLVYAAKINTPAKKQEVETEHDNKDGTVRINVNSSIRIRNGIMENINFKNLNEERILKFKIRFNETIIYRSGYVNPGEEIISDSICSLDKAINSGEATVEVSYYTLKKEYIGQTNVKVELSCFN